MSSRYVLSQVMFVSSMLLSTLGSITGDMQNAILFAVFGVLFYQIGVNSRE